MRRLLPLLLIGLLAGPAHGHELRVALGVQDSAGAGKPQAQSGGLASFNQALAREICRRLVSRCTTANVLFTEILPGIENGQYDLGFGNYLRTPEREQRVAFSAPLWRSSSRLVAVAGQQPRDLSLETLRGVSLVTVQGTQQANYLHSLPAERRLRLSEVTSMAEAMRQLRTGRADFALLPMLSAYALLSQEKPGQFEFVGPPLTANGLGGTVHIALPKGADDLRQSVDQAIAALRADGSYHRITRQYFPFSLD